MMESTLLDEIFSSKTLASRTVQRLIEREKGEDDMNRNEITRF